MTAPNSFNTGRDGYQLTIISATLGKITFNGITSFETKPTVVKLKSVALDGRIRHRTIVRTLLSIPILPVSKPIFLPDYRRMQSLSPIPSKSSTARRVSGSTQTLH